MGDNSATYLNENGYARPHHRVLKPPGGETHDIFGTGQAGHLESSPTRRNRNHLQSNIFGGDETDASQAASKLKNGNGNRSNIFGGQEDEDEELLKQRKVKDHLKSNVFGNGNEPETNGSAGQRRQIASNGQGGNPITGEGYVNGSQNSEPKENGQSVTRVRNPPGGYSTKLW